MYSHSHTISKFSLDLLIEGFVRGHVIAGNMNYKEIENAWNTMLAEIKSDLIMMNDERLGRN